MFIRKMDEEITTQTQRKKGNIKRRKPGKRSRKEYDVPLERSVNPKRKLVIDNDTTHLMSPYKDQEIAYHHGLYCRARREILIGIPVVGLGPAEDRILREKFQK